MVNLTFQLVRKVDFRYSFIGWVVQPVINLIEQTQGTNLPSVPQTTKFTLAQLSALQTMLSSEPK